MAMGIDWDTDQGTWTAREEERRGEITRWIRRNSEQALEAPRINAMGKYQERSVRLKVHPEGGRVKRELWRKLTGRACRKQARTAAEKVRELVQRLLVLGSFVVCVSMILS
jgi:hypothetical protein